MHRCLELAEKGRGIVGNGAMVGAVLVRGDSIIAEGWHQEWGKLHGERNLLEKFDQKIRSDDILYVNLEPCCHQGKTPPCTNILIEKGVKNVAVGMQDPDERVSGQGIALLRGKGINVSGPILPELCERLNRGFDQVRTKGRPWVTLKLARTRDGHFSHEDGKPLKITNHEQDSWSHYFIRARHDAIIVGIGTILSDDPKLDTRFAHEYKNYSENVPPWRIILDADLKIPLEARVLRDERKDRTMIVTTKNEGEKWEELTQSGVRVLTVPVQNGRFDWEVLWEKLITPEGDYHGLTSVLVEGGRKTWDIFRKDKMVDEEVTLVGN